MSLLNVTSCRNFLRFSSLVVAGVMKLFLPSMTSVSCDPQSVAPSFMFSLQGDVKRRVSKKQKNMTRVTCESYNSPSCWGTPSRSRCFSVVWLLPRQEEQLNCCWFVQAVVAWLRRWCNVRDARQLGLARAPSSTAARFLALAAPSPLAMVGPPGGLHSNAVFTLPILLLLAFWQLLDSHVAMPEWHPRGRSKKSYGRLCVSHNTTNQTAPCERALSTGPWPCGDG